MNLPSRTCHIVPCEMTLKPKAIFFVNKVSGKVFSEHGMGLGILKGIYVRVGMATGRVQVGFLKS